jgi:type IV pilus assembly protein PilY1
MRKNHVILLGVLAAFVGISVLAAVTLNANAGTCNYPLFVQAGSVDANVVILFDTSGSMNEAICHDAYNPNITYSGGLTSTNTYTVNSSGTYSARSFRSGLPRNPTAYLVASDGGHAGEYTGNYLNWVFYHASSTQRAEIPQQTRIQMAKGAVNAILGSASPSIRFGLFKFNNDNGAVKVSDLGTSIGTIQTKVNALEGDSWTPLAESLVSIMSYLKTPGGAGAPIQYACQKSFVVIVTDGYPTKDISVSTTYTGGEPAGTCADLGAIGYPSSNDCSGFLDNVAGYLRNTDLRTDLEGQQYACTYTVGMNINAPILAATATAGDGEYFVANNASQLSESLTRVFRDIVNRISAGSAVAVVSTEGQTADYLYRGKFDPSKWTGALEAFQLPYETGDAPVWEAGERLASRDPATRTIFTYTGGAKRDFTAANVSTLKTPMGISNTTTATEVINWVRGTDATGYRDRGDWPLGDIVESSPVPVGVPSGFYMFNNYSTFRDAKLNREQVVYVGANDGMLHCFSALTGDEKWAFIPGQLLPRMDDLAATGYCHEYFVNLAPRAADVYTGGSWRTLLVGGLREGGNAYYALDVTDPASPTVLWENAITEVSQSWATAEIARMKTNGKFVAFVGSGPKSTGETYLVGMDMENGAALWKTLLYDHTASNMATSCTAVDLDLDGYDDVLYVADLTGRLWRVGLTGTSPSPSLLFQTPSNQPIQAQPIVTVDYNNSVYVYFGTGRYVDSSDITTTYAQRFYCVIDNHTGGTVSTSSLLNQTSTINPPGSNNRGWYIDLANRSGERVIQPAALVAGVVYFTSFAPSNASCSGGGSSWLYAAKWKSGAAYDDDKNDSNDTASGRSQSMGDGITARPVVDVVNEKILIQGSDTRVHVEDTRGRLRQMIVRSYRQQY